MQISRDNILDIISKESLVDRTLLTPDATLESLGIASMDIVSIVFALEDKFGLVLDSDFDDVKTVDDVVKLIQEKAAAAGGAAHSS